MIDVEREKRIRDMIEGITQLLGSQIASGCHRVTSQTDARSERVETVAYLRSVAHVATLLADNISAGKHTRDKGNSS